MQTGRGSGDHCRHSRNGGFQRCFRLRSVRLRTYRSEETASRRHLHAHIRGHSARRFSTDHGRVRQYLFEARKRGVIFRHLGHGGGSFLFRQAVPAIRQGFLPNSISTDLHTESMNAGMKDILNVMSKLLNIGMSLPDVVTRATWNPAREIKRTDLGTLTPGSVADSWPYYGLRKGNSVSSTLMERACAARKSWSAK